MERRRSRLVIWLIGIGLIFAVAVLITSIAVGLIDYFDAIPYKVVTIFITLILLSNLGAKLALMFVYMRHDERVTL